MDHIIKSLWYFNPCGQEQNQCITVFLICQKFIVVFFILLSVKGLIPCCLQQGWLIAAQTNQAIHQLYRSINMDHINQSI